MTTNLPPLTAKDFECEYDGKWYPFFEDEYCRVATYGHDHDAEFADQVTAFNMDVGGLNREDALQLASGVHHYWAVVTDPDEWELNWEGVTEDTPNAFPMSVIYQ